MNSERHRVMKRKQVHALTRSNVQCSRSYSRLIPRSLFSCDVPVLLPVRVHVRTLVPVRFA
ncbi:hypothetical protein HMPREF3190_00793 [Umbribacter vaginalis]|nr:hypothetical protein HMPREF3190_00793 [Coriobacteriales bacterium DNF00809]